MDDGTRTLRVDLARVVSHDLRGPLRAIKGFGQRLDAAGSLDGDARAHLSRIRAAADSLDAMMVDLVDWLRIDTVDAKRAAVDLSLLADWATMELMEGDPGRDARVDVQPEMQAIGDEHLLRQLMQRLLGAAWRRAGVAAPVRITVSAGDEPGATLLCIRDEGRVPVELAGEFAALRDPADNDIGMTIARLVAARHGGTLAMETAADGTTVRVRLPD